MIIPDLSLASMSILVIVAVIAWKVLDKVVDYFWKRIIKDDYLTIKACEKCKGERKDDDNSFKREMREKLGIMTGAIVVLAAGKDLPLEEIQKLISAGVTQR